MVYHVKDSEIQTWYISIEEKDEWKVSKQKELIIIEFS